MIDIKEYLDIEIGKQTPLKNVVKTIRKNLAPGLVDKFNRFTEEGIDDEREMYDFLAQRANGKPIYDYLMQAYRACHEAKHNTVLGRVLSVHPRTLLDMCCGTGIDTCLFAQALGEKSRVYGADFSEEMLKRARERAQRRKLDNVSFQIADINNIPFNEPHFDVITCFMGLFESLGVKPSHPQYEFVESTCVVDRLTKLGKALNPNGLLICSGPIPNEDSQAGYMWYRFRKYLDRADFGKAETKVVELERREGGVYKELFAFARKE